MAHLLPTSRCRAPGRAAAAAGRAAGLRRARSDGRSPEPADAGGTATAAPEAGARGVG